MKRDRVLWLLVGLALLLRVMTALTLDAAAPLADRGGDSGWYLANGYTLLTGQQAASGIIAQPETLGQPPLYFVFIGLPQALLPADQAVTLIRLMQALAGALTVLLVCSIAAQLGGKLAGHIAGAAVAISPAFVLESAQIKTETLYMLLLTAGVWAAMRMLQARTWRWAALAGMCFGLAALTRAVALGYLPVVLVVVLLGAGLRSGWRLAAALALSAALVISTWTVYNLVRYQRLVISGTGLTAFVYLGAAGWQGPQQTDAQLGLTESQAPVSAAGQQQVYAEQAAQIIREDTAGYLAHRLGEWAGALLQPFGTEAYAGESLRALAADWWANDRSPGGLARLAQGEAFWEKLALYVLHFSAAALGAAGLFVCRRRWRLALLPASYIAFTLAIHLVLMALPRYFFPVQPLLWAFAGVALAALWRARPFRRTAAVPGT